MFPWAGGLLPSFVLGFFLAMLLVRFLRLCNRYLVHIVYIIIVFVYIYIYIFCILGFLGFAVIVILILFGISPGQGSACVFWVLFLVHFCSFPQAGGLFVSFWFLFVFCFCIFFFSPGRGLLVSLLFMVRFTLM